MRFQTDSHLAFVHKPPTDRKACDARAAAALQPNRLSIKGNADPREGFQRRMRPPCRSATPSKSSSPLCGQTRPAAPYARDAPRSRLGFSRLRCLPPTHTPKHLHTPTPSPSSPDSSPAYCPFNTSSSRLPWQGPSSPSDPKTSSLAIRPSNPPSVA
jgi:hypothetical protein